MPLFSSVIFFFAEPAARSHLYIYLFSEWKMSLRAFQMLDCFALNDKSLLDERIYAWTRRMYVCCASSERISRGFAFLEPVTVDAIANWQSTLTGMPRTLSNHHRQKQLSEREREREYRKILKRKKTHTQRVATQPNIFERVSRFREYKIPGGREIAVR